MARIFPILATQFTVFFILSFFTINLATGDDETFVRSVDRELLGVKKEKLSHFRLYWHDMVSGRNPSSIPVVQPEVVGLLMAMNFAFMEGKYNGSTITILGRNPVFAEVREMPVIGGSGLFRFARGYVQARTHWLDNKTGDAIVRYDCYVMHY
ncbi:hypothetical protein SLA2020_427210 [Shorea laevis]